MQVSAVRNKISEQEYKEIIQRFKNSSGAKLCGDYSKIQKKSGDAGYPLIYVLKIYERLHQLFPAKSDKLKFVDTIKEVFDGCCGTDKVPVRKVKLIRNGQEVDFEPVELFKKPRWFSAFFDGHAIKRIGMRHAEKYNAELETIGLRQYLLAYYQAALKLAKRVK